MKKVRFADEEMSEEKVEEKTFFTWLQSIFFCEPSKIYKEEEEEDEETVEDITVEVNFVQDNMEPVSVALRSHCSWRAMQWTCTAGLLEPGVLAM